MEGPPREPRTTSLPLCPGSVPSTEWDSSETCLGVALHLTLRCGKILASNKLSNCIGEITGDILFSNWQMRLTLVSSSFRRSINLELLHKLGFFYSF